MSAIRRRGRRVGALVLSAGVLVTGAGPAAAALAPGAYHGSSSQKLPVSLTVAGGRISKLSVDWNATCTRASHYPSWTGIETTQTRYPIHSGQTWTASGRYRARGNGFREAFQVTDHGTLTRRLARGVFSGKLWVYSVATATHTSRWLATCASGPVTFTLKRSA